MSESTKEEMLDEFDCCVHNASILFGIDERSKVVLDSVRSLIEHGPEVSREFVEIRVNEMEQMFKQKNSRKEREWFIKKRTLTEAGVRVKEADDE